MTRPEAEALVAPHVHYIQQYQAVSVEVAETLLGEERCARMLKDKIRGLGPSSCTVYPWNVADYLQFPDLNAS